MSKPDKCPTCGKPYTGGSALYDYYQCGHAFEKPLVDEEKGKWVFYPSPHATMNPKQKAPSDE